MSATIHEIEVQSSMMLRRSRVLDVARELVMRFVSVERALRLIQRLLQEQPGPREVMRIGQC